MKKFLKVSLIIVLGFLIIFAALFCTYLVITKDAVLDKNKLSNPHQTVIIYDDEGNEITNASVSNKNKSVKLSELSDDCINAFIASEDRKFYSHNGLNYGRMVKALFKNIAAGSFKEGASTISQQLIKNTHLSNDKTIKRKLNEIRLTKQLEKEYTKDEILETYLNTIYFGHNCYGLQSAAEFYFGKKAENLTLTESATLVGLLASPNNYSPFKNPEKSIKKRNTVLNAMLECGFINEKTCAEAKAQPLNAQQPAYSGANSDYINAVFDELGDIEINAYDLTDGCIIKTYLDQRLQKHVESLEYDCDNAVIVTSASGGVNAYKSTINGARRQPGSTIKPFLVYAPAIDEGIISPFTRILDEKINFGGYSPENYDKKYHGYVTVTDSLKFSYNVPAVKTLNTLTVQTAEKYLTRMNIVLDEDEKNLSLALGGMKYGFSLKELSDNYSVFQNGGIYSPSRFIKEIVTKDGKTLYKNEFSKSRAFSEGACSLMNEMLIETSKNGTAKFLADLPYDVATKTGTCGTEDGNTDAYAISYTSDKRVCVWLGDKNNKKLSITGGGSCCKLVKSILNELYTDTTPEKLEVSNGTSTVNIDAEDYYENNKITVADELSPKLNVLTVKVLKGREPKNQNTKFSSPEIAMPEIFVKNNAVNIRLCQTKYYAYIIKRGFNGKFTTIYDGKWKEIITDSPEAGIYSYTVTPYFVSENKKICGKEITLPLVSIGNDGNSPQIKIPDIANKNWYDL